MNRQESNGMHRTARQRPGKVRKGRKAVQRKEG